MKRILKSESDLSLNKTIGKNLILLVTNQEAERKIKFYSDESTVNCGKIKLIHREN